MSRVSNTLKQALLLWSMLLVLALWLGFNQASTAMKFGVTVALIIIAGAEKKDRLRPTAHGCPDCRPKHIGSP